MIYPTVRNICYLFDTYISRILCSQLPKAALVLPSPALLHQIGQKERPQPLVVNSARHLQVGAQSRRRHRHVLGQSNVTEHRKQGNDRFHAAACAHWRYVRHYQFVGHLGLWKSM